MSLTGHASWLPTYAVLALAILSGCASTYTYDTKRIYEHASVNAHPKHGFAAVVAGTNFVLQKTYYRSNPWAFDAIGGYTLHVEFPQALLFQDSRIEIPSKECRASLMVLSAPISSYAEDISGFLRVVEVNPDGIKLSMEIASKSLKWTLSGEELFRYAKHSCLKHPDWACEYYTK